MRRPRLLIVVLLLVSQAGCGKGGSVTGVIPGTPEGWVQVSSPGGGTVQALIVKGASLFAGTETGGMYRSTDDGVSWTRFGSGMRDLITITALAASEKNLFAASFAFGFWRRRL